MSRWLRWWGESLRHYLDRLDRSEGQNMPLTLAANRGEDVLDPEVVRRAFEPQRFADPDEVAAQSSQPEER